VGFPGEWQVLVCDINNNLLKVLNSDNAGYQGEKPGNTGCFGSNSMQSIEVVQR
jgi:hypothetical protein